MKFSNVSGVLILVLHSISTYGVLHSRTLEIALQGSRNSTAFWSAALHLHKAAHEMLKQNERTLKTNKTTLFGPGFYKALHRRAKGTKQSREIRQHLAPSYSHKIKSSHRGGFSGSSTRPFRRGPSSKTNERELVPPSTGVTAEASVVNPGMYRFTIKPLRDPKIPIPLTKLTDSFPKLSVQETLTKGPIHTHLAQMDLINIPDPGQVGGRIAHYLANWQQITTDQNVLQTVKGYQIEFASLPTHMGNPKFGVVESQNIDIEVQTMLEKGAIERVHPTVGQFVGHVFLRPKKNRTYRLVFNLKPLNQYIVFRHFKMESMTIC